MPDAGFPRFFRFDKKTVTPPVPPANHLDLYGFDRLGRMVLRYLTPTGLEVQLAQDQIAVARNNTGVQINKGQVVYINGQQGNNRPTVALAQSNADATMPAWGLAAENIADSSDGFIQISGLLESIDTSAFAAGDTVWVSSSVAGGLQNTKPAVPPNFPQVIGRVLNSSGSQGRIFIIQSAMRGNFEGTNESTFNVGSTASGGARDLILRNSAGSITIRGTPTGTRIITAPDATGTMALLELAQTFTAKITFTPTSTTPGVNLGVFAGDPSAPSNGDTWYNSTTGKFRGRQNGANVDLIQGQVIPSPQNTFYAVYDRIVPAANKYMATLFNTSATRKVVIQRIWVLNWQVVAVTGVNLEQYLARITARTVGTAITIRAADTNDSLSAGISGDHNSSAVTEDHIIKRHLATNEEGSALSTQLGEDFMANDWNFQLVYRRWEGTKGITLRQNQGVSLRNVTSSTVGTCSYIIEFTDEAA